MSRSQGGMNMAQYNNQFTIHISPHIQWGNYQELVQASRELHSSAFKLFLFLTSHRPDTDLIFYPSVFCEEFSVSMSSEKRSFQELLDKGYLQQKTVNYFIFNGVQNE